MAGKSLGQSATSGAIWASIDKFGSMGIQFIVNLLLAHLLLPADFGMIGMLTIFIAVSQTLIDGGFGSAIIQKKNPTQADYSTIFFWNLAFSGILYLILYFCSPLISRFYRMPELTGVLRVMALTLIITGIYSIQKTRLQKVLAFKKIAIVNISAYLIGAVIALLMAYKGLGVWSLVGMQVSYATFCVIMVALVTRWHPDFCFSKSSMKELFNFGGYIMAANILQTICQNLQGLIIGRRFSAVQMGYYAQANKLDMVTAYSIPQVIVQVMYPVYSSIQDDKERLNSMVLMNMRVIAYIMFPILSILILSANPLIEFLYGVKWLPSAPYFQVLCVGGFFVSLQNLNFYAVAAVGKSKSLFNASIYKWTFLLLALIIGMNFGMYGILWGLVLSSGNIFMTNAYLSAKHTGLKINSQLKAILPILLLSGVALGCGFLLEYLGCNIWIVCVVSMLAYLVISFIFHFKAITETRLLILRLKRN